jgi:hypothetical protein
MRVLLLPGLNKSHLYVMVPLAWALRSAGHDVLVAAQPDMAGDIAPTGLPGIAVGPPLGLAAKMARVDPAAGPPAPAPPAAAARSAVAVQPGGGGPAAPGVAGGVRRR